ncbi:MAG: PspA/IM30 family protein [Gammaproteobacteria bacterium]|nr:PspA/IM30 family protein [Gammaproteobacteria bacterium]
MALLRRLTRLFRADLHAVLDRIEEPVALLRQAVREMEDALREDEQRAKFLTHEQSELATRSAEAERMLSELETKLDLCFDADETDLARSLVKRKLELEGARVRHGNRHAGLSKQLVELQTRIANHRDRLDGMRQKLDLLGEEEADRCEPNFAGGVGVSECVVADDEIEIAWLQEKRRRGLS